MLALSFKVQVAESLIIVCCRMLRQLRHWMSQENWGNFWNLSRWEQTAFHVSFIIRQSSKWTWLLCIFLEFQSQHRQQWSTHQSQHWIKKLLQSKSKSKSKVKSQKDFEWLYSAVVPPTHHHHTNFSQQPDIQLSSNFHSRLTWPRLNDFRTNQEPSPPQIQLHTWRIG